MADLGAIEEDVRFDYGAADRLVSLCDSAAGVIDGQAGSRASWKNTALTEFRGHFSELFRSNASVASADAGELADRLREVAGFTRRLKEEAEKEQQRRETARQWKQEQDDRNLWDKGVDKVFGGDDPPVGPPAAEPTFPVAASRNGTRETPAPGSGGGGGGGTSSAKPEDLRAFANGSRGANSTLRPKVTTTRSAYNTFVAGCGWGRLEASGVFSGFDQYVDANDEDVRWATTVADAFAAAGGEGAVSTLSNSALMASLQAAGVGATRQDIVIDPPTAYGSPPTTGYANDPVNTATGNFLENEVDLSFPGGASSLALTRTYNSFDTGAGAFGTGWSSWTEARLDLDGEAGRMRLADGRVVVFPRLGDGWDRATGGSTWLTAVDGGFRAADNAGRTWEFGPAGALVAVSSGAGTRVSLVRDDDRVVRLEHERGRWVELTWHGDLVVAATTSDGRHVDYAYDDSGRLTGVTGPAGTRHYGWDDETGLISSVTDADGVLEAENTYDERGRVTSQRSQFGRLTRFAYLPGNVTVVSDPDGTRSNTWIHDHLGRMIGVVDAHEQRQSTAYDPHGNAVLVTARDGSATVHEYDERGRKVRTVTPTGADVTFGYDDLDRVTTVVTESGAVTEYSYDDDGRPRGRS